MYLVLIILICVTQPHAQGKELYMCFMWVVAHNSSVLTGIGRKSFKGIVLAKLLTTLLLVNNSVADWAGSGRAINSDCDSFATLSANPSSYCHTPKRKNTRRLILSRLPVPNSNIPFIDCLQELLAAKDAFVERMTCGS